MKTPYMTCTCWCWHCLPPCPHLFCPTVSARVKTSLLEHLEGVSDPRIERTRRHKLLDILAIAICAMICGAEH